MAICKGVCYCAKYLISNFVSYNNLSLFNCFTSELSKAKIPIDIEVALWFSRVEGCLRDESS